MDLAARMLIEVLREGQSVRYTARGGSMWPMVRDGATVVIDPCEASTLRPGELGAYEGPRGLVVHRVVAQEAGGVRFRGDSRPHDDGVIAPDRVLGRAAVVGVARLRWAIPSPRVAVLSVFALRSWLRRRFART